MISLLLLAGCDVEYRDDGEDSSVYIRVSDADGSDIHSIYGGIEVVDSTTGFPVPDSRVYVEIQGNGGVVDAFTVVTGPEGITRFEIGEESYFRPYDSMYFEVRRPGYAPLSDTIPVEEISVISDGIGYNTLIYEADAVVELAPL